MSQVPVRAPYVEIVSPKKPCATSSVPYPSSMIAIWVGFAPPSEPVGDVDQGRAAAWMGLSINSAVAKAMLLLPCRACRGEGGATRMSQLKCSCSSFLMYSRWTRRHWVAEVMSLMLLLGISWTGPVWPAAGSDVNK
jgi:hypothetical protein